MTTFYVGKRPVLRGRSDTANVYTGLLGHYSNWDLMYKDQVLTGAPDKNRVPGVPLSSYGGEGDVLMSGLFTGQQQALGFRFRLRNPLNKVDPASVKYYYGNYPTYQYRGLSTNYVSYTTTNRGTKYIVNPGVVYGHLGYNPNLPLNAAGDPIGMGPSSPYREWDYYYHGLINNQVLKSPGHPIRFTSPSKGVQGLADMGEPWDVDQQAATFGSFAPYVYKGVNAAFNPTPANTAEGELGAFGHTYRAANSVGTTADHYGEEHVREWFGVPSARAMSGGTPATGSNTYPILPPKL